MDTKEVLTAANGIWSYDFVKSKLSGTFTDRDGQLLTLEIAKGTDPNYEGVRSATVVTIQRQTPSGRLRTWLAGCVPVTEGGAVMTEDIISARFDDNGRTFEALITFQTRALTLREMVKGEPAAKVRLGHIEGTHAYRTHNRDRDEPC